MERAEASFANLLLQKTIANEIAATNVSSGNLDMYRPSALFLPQQTSKRWADSSFQSVPLPSNPLTSTSAALDTFRSMQDGAAAFRTPRMTPSVQSCRSHEEANFKQPCMSPMTRVVRSEQEYGYQTGPQSPEVVALREAEEGFKLPARSPQLTLLRKAHEDPFQPLPESSSATQGHPLTPPQSPLRSPLLNQVRKDVEGFKEVPVNPLIEAFRAQETFRSTD